MAAQEPDDRPPDLRSDVSGQELGVVEAALPPAGVCGWRPRDDARPGNGGRDLGSHCGRQPRQRPTMVPVFETGHELTSRAFVGERCVHSGQTRHGG